MQCAFIYLFVSCVTLNVSLITHSHWWSCVYTAYVRACLHGISRRWGALTPCTLFVLRLLIYTFACGNPSTHTCRHSKVFVLRSFTLVYWSLHSIYTCLDFRPHLLTRVLIYSSIYVRSLIHRRTHGIILRLWFFVSSVFMFLCWVYWRQEMTVLYADPCSGLVVLVSCHFNLIAVMIFFLFRCVLWCCLMLLGQW